MQAQAVQDVLISYHAERCAAQDVSSGAEQVPQAGVDNGEQAGLHLRKSN